LTRAQQQRGVVGQRTGHVGLDVASHGLQRLFRIRMAQQADAFGEWVEDAAAVACLGDAVGVKQQLVARMQGDRVRDGPVGAERGQAQGRGGLRRFGAQQQRRGMPVVQQGDAVFVVDLDQDGGDELLALKTPTTSARRAEPATPVAQSVPVLIVPPRLASRPTPPLRCRRPGSRKE